MIKKIKSTTKRSWSWICEKIDNGLDGTDQHHTCFFPAKNTGGVFFLSRSFFKGIRFSERQIEEIKKIPEDAVIVYANKYKSHSDFLFYHTRYSQESLPVPEIGFDYRFFFLQPISRIFKIVTAHLRYFFKNWRILNPYTSGYIRDEIINGRTALLSLVEKKGFYLRFVKSNPDPLRHLIEIQKETDRPIYIVPQLIFFGKIPHRSTPSMIDIFFGTRENPGKTRRMISMMRPSEHVFLEISEPMELNRFLDHPDHKDLSINKQALLLRRQLLKQLNLHRQSITGPVIKSPEELKENILTNDRLRDFMSHHAEKGDTPLYKVFKEADGYLEEIAAKYKINYIRFLSVWVKLLTSLMFEGISINTEVLDRVKNMARRGPLILVPCHKSHIDYLIISYLMFHNDMPCPHIAAGKNLSFWPMGPIFRGCGAFFIRRTFKGAVLYSKVFSEYVHKILEEGFNIEFFIEGGRSRTGKLLRPKLGLLSILLNAYRNGACEDMIFVPVFVGYDRVPEEGAYLRELEGVKKDPESLGQMLKARKVLKKRYGRIYLRFHDGISLKDLLEEQGTPIEEMSSKEQNRLCRNLGNMFLNSIDKVTVLTPHAIVAGAILNNGRIRFSFDQLMGDINTYMNYLNTQDVLLADTLVVDQQHAFEYVFDVYENRKFIEKIFVDKDNPPAEQHYTVRENKRPALEYYKNNCVTAFTPAAFTALAILEKDAFQFTGSGIYEGYERLREFFVNEFSGDSEKTPEYYVHKNIKAFMDDAILSPHPTLPDTYNLTSAGYRKLRLFAAFLTPYFESYWITLTFFTRYPKNFVESKDRVKKIYSMGNRMYKKKEIERPEAVSRISFKNAIDYFSSHGVRGSEDEEKIQSYADMIRRYLDLLQS